MSDIVHCSFEKVCGQLVTGRKHLLLLYLLVEVIRSVLKYIRHVALACRVDSSTYSQMAVNPL